MRIISIRRKGHQSIADTFPAKTLALWWVREIEAEVDALKFKDVRGLANVTLKTFINRYTEEIGAEHPVEKNKMAILNHWVTNHGDKFAIDLSFLAGVFKTAKQLWQLPVIQFCTPFGERAERKTAHDIVMAQQILHRAQRHNHPSCCH